MSEPLQPYLLKDRIEAGCDEAGRGCLAGPVVAAAVVWLPDNAWLAEGDNLINDSKQLTAHQREQLYDDIILHADAYAISAVEAEEIDRINIYKASCLAMSKAAEALEVVPDHLLIDGNRFVPFTQIPYTCVVHGDARCLSIASASILAKVYRDRLMVEMEQRYPGYGFARHKGYPTPEHKRAIRALGTTPIHRMSYAPCQPSLGLDV